MRISVVTLMFYIINSCNMNYVNESMVNSSHLNHLYQEFTWPLDSTTIGTIWIYCNSPNYSVLDDEDEGFTCVDDISRALVFFVRQYKSNPNNKDFTIIKNLTHTLLKMQHSEGYFYNFLFPDLSINKEHQNSKTGPGYWSWRAFWALTEVSEILSGKDSSLLNSCWLTMDKLIANIKSDMILVDSSSSYSGIEVNNIIDLYGTDQISLLMIALTNYSKHKNDDQVKEMITSFGESLLTMQIGSKDNFPFGTFLSWRNIWHAWGNIQSYALLYSGKYLQNQSFINAALLEIDHFYPYLAKELWLSEMTFGKANGEIQMLNKNQFPQIAYGIRPAVFACLEAYDITTDEKYAKLAGQLASWLLGNNLANRIMYDLETGICYDGINSSISVNLNSGAESTIESLLTLQLVEQNPVALNEMLKYAIY